MTYHWLRIRADDRSWQAAWEELDTAALAPLWGAFRGLFGISTSELLVVSGTDDPEKMVEAIEDAGFGIVDGLPMTPTARPREFAPVDEDGVYVFRFFDVASDVVDEVVELSTEAWTTFEDDDAYEAEVQGLFREAEPEDEREVMMLVTRYADLASWETSRTPSPVAMDLFRRRHELTAGAIAIATRPIPTPT
ncbi:MAG: hypothetical protein S0880_01120 [Actinomycetota bacterium]|nr:hypothetical protein [Actinomycetota bacterium]